MNSLYDPDLSGTGHQPYQFDQIKTMYGTYLVHKCDWTITFFGAAVTGLWVGVSIYNTIGGTSVAGFTLDAIKERNLTKMIPLPSTGEQKVTLSGSTNLWDIFGVTKEQYLAEPQAYGSAVSGNPAYSVQLECVLVDPAARTSASVLVDADLNFKSQLWAYVPPTQS